MDNHLGLFILIGEAAQVLFLKRQNKKPSLAKLG